MITDELTYRIREALVSAVLAVLCVLSIMEK